MLEATVTLFQSLFLCILANVAQHKIFLNVLCSVFDSFRVMSSIFTDKKNLAGPSRHCQYLHHVELVSKFPGSIAIRLVSASSLACQASSYGKSGFYGIVGEYNLQMQLNLSFLFRVPSTVCNKTHLSHNVALKKQSKRQASVKS